MTCLFVDLAERHSAAVLVGDQGTVLGETTNDAGKFGRPQTAAETIEVFGSLLSWVTDGAMAPLLVQASHVAIEDVTPFSVNIKPAERAQTALVWAVHLARPDGVDVRFATAMTWQRHFGYKKTKGKTSKGWAKEWCSLLGYAPTGTAKEREDLRDAYLGARWLRDVTRELD